jgi:hypothetical protein
MPTLIFCTIIQNSAAGGRQTQICKIRPNFGKKSLRLSLRIFMTSTPYSVARGRQTQKSINLIFKKTLSVLSCTLKDLIKQLSNGRVKMVFPPLVFN